MTESEPLSYARKPAVPPVPRLWGLSRLVWLLIAGTCGFVEFAGEVATGGRVNGRSDVAFIVTFAVVGVIALINSLRLLWRAP